MRQWLLLYFLLVGGCEVQAIGFPSWEFFDASQGIRSDEDAEDTRDEMIDLVFGEPIPTRFPDEVRLHTDPIFPRNLIQRIVVDTDDLRSIAYLIHPSSWNGSLAIYHQGHGGDFRELGAETISGLLDAEYQVLAFSMPMLGMNTHPFNTDEHVELSDREHPLRYFIDPVVVALNWAEATYAYSRRFMVGLSGGGWTTVVVAAIDERIDASYPVAGSWPHYLRDLYGSFGDWEERITPNYLELYLMATHPGRSQTQIFNELDSCCFGGTYAFGYLAYTSYRANLWEGRFQILLDHGQMDHVISEYSLGQILELESPGR
jgi:hypothetical protein